MKIQPLGSVDGGRMNMRVEDRHRVGEVKVGRQVSQEALNTGQLEPSDDLGG